MLKDISKILENKKNELQKELINAALVNQPKVTNIATDYSIVNKMLNLIDDDNVSKNKRSNQDKQISNENKQATMVTLDYDFTGKRPVLLNIFNKTYQTNSFRSLVESLCFALYEHDTTNFINLENISSVNGDKHKYFSRKRSDLMDEPILIGSEPQAIYVDVAKLAINNLFFMKRVCKAMGINPSDVTIGIDPNYKRKPRTKK